MTKRDKNFYTGDYVTFHTKYGTTTGIIEEIYMGSYAKGIPQKAKISVKYQPYRTKSYMRPLYKLKHLQ